MKLEKKDSGVKTGRSFGVPAVVQQCVNSAVKKRKKGGAREVDQRPVSRNAVTGDLEFSGQDEKQECHGERDAERPLQKLSDHRGSTRLIGEKNEALLYINTAFFEDIVADESFD